MVIRSRLAYWFGEIEVLSKVETEFSFINQNGEEIYRDSNTKKVNSKKLYGSPFNRFWEVRAQLRKKNKGFLNKESLTRLKKCRKQKKVTLERGVVIPGDYIVKCVWDIIPSFRTTTYKEFLAMRNGKYANQEKAE